MAVTVCTPAGLALLLATWQTWGGYVGHWLEMREIHPAFPPSFFDFFLRAQVTSLPGRSALNNAMAEEVLELLAAADDDVDAEARGWDRCKGLVALAVERDA